MSRSPQISLAMLHSSFRRVLCYVMTFALAYAVKHVSESVEFKLHSVASLRGGRQPAPGVTILGWHYIIMWNHNSTDLWWTPYFFHFVWSSPSSFGLKTHWFLGEDLFFLVFTCFWTENPFILLRRPFFSGLHLFLVRKRVPPRNPAPGATIFSNASDSTHHKNYIISFRK